MKTLTAFCLSAAVALATVTVPPTPTALGSESTARSADTVLSLSDQTAAGIRGALAGRWKCAIVFGFLGAGLIAGAIVTGGAAVAIAAPFALNAAAVCLI